MSCLRSSLALSAPLLLTGAASAQVQDGDVLVCLFDVAAFSLEHFLEDGTPVMTFNGTGQYWEGVVETAGGLLATTSRSPNSLHLFDASGAEVAIHNTPEIGFLPGDLDRFQDGVLAVMDQGGDVELYDENGVHQTTFVHAQMVHPFGCTIDAQDHLWVADITGVGDNAGLIFEFDRAGAALQVITTTFDPGDLVVDGDGSLWIADRSGGMVAHLDSTGGFLASFDPQTSGNFEGIGLHPDGTLYLAGEGDDQIRRFSKQGVELGGFPIPTNGAAVFLVVAGGGQIGTSFCFGDASGGGCPCLNAGGGGQGCANSTGVGGILRGKDSASVADDALTFSASQLTPNQPALLFAGSNAVAGGNGVFFGDGLRCAGGTVQRLGIAVANATGDAVWGPGLIAAGGWSSGDTRRFQAWYRDPIARPCGSAFNLTQGVELQFQP